jgi:hypothetical protein
MKKILIKTVEAGGYNRVTTTSDIMEVADDWEHEKEEGTIFKHTHIDDYNYFSMIDNQVRQEYALCEEYSIKPLIEKMYKDAGVSTDNLKQYPVEGYYYKTPGLRQYFQLVRNLQETPEVYNEIEDSKETEEIIWLLGNSIWGTVSSDRSLTPFPRMKDIMTHTLNGLVLKDEWTIPKIMAKLEKSATGNTNLVELAYLTNDVRCLTAGCETNALYREMSLCYASGISNINVEPRYPKEVFIYHWDVTEKVDEMGPKLVNKYNEVIERFQTEKDDSNRIYSMGGRRLSRELIAPTLINRDQFTWFLESPRVAMLGQCEDDRQYYHWILDKNEVKEEWSAGIITTETYTNNQPPVSFDDWDTSGKEPERPLGI